MNTQARAATVTPAKTHRVNVAHAKKGNENGTGKVVTSGRDGASVAGASGSTAITIAKGQTPETRDEDFEEF